jgi:hypothetical protein
MEENQGDTSRRTELLPPLSLTITRNNPRLAKEGFKTFQGLASDERTMLYQALNNILNDDKSKLRKFFVQKKIKEFKQQLQNDELTLDELRDILVEIVKPTYVQNTEAPHRIKYHSQFLEKYYGNQEHGKHSSQESKTVMTDSSEEQQDEERDIDDDSITVIPDTEPNLKKPRTTTTKEDQTTLTQIWTPTRQARMTQQDDQDEDVNEGTGDEDYRTPKQRPPITNPYAKKKANTIVTPQKTQTNTHTKPKQGLPHDTANLKSPPSYSIIPQTQTEAALSRELIDMVHNTERIMDKATEEFHRTDKDDKSRGQKGQDGHSLVIDGIGSPFTATNETALKNLNKYMEDLGDKYRRIIKEHEDMKNNHEQAFRQTLQDIARRYEQQARINMEHIITTQSGQAESNFTAQLQKISKPHAADITKQILAQLKADTIRYTQKLEREYLAKQEEMISDLDHYHSKASEILEETMEDFYLRTVPFTVPPKLTEYIDQHLEERVTEMVQIKFDAVLEKKVNAIIESKLEGMMEEKYNNTLDKAIQRRMKLFDIGRQITRYTETIQQAETIRKELYEINHTSQSEIQRHRNAITVATDIAKATINEHGHTTQDKIQTYVTQALQHVRNNTDTCTNNIHRSKEEAITAISIQKDQACQELQRRTKEEQQSQAPASNMNKELDDAIAKINQEANRIKREIQSDKDRYSQALTNERSRHVEALEAKITDAIEQIKDTINANQASFHATQREHSTGNNYSQSQSTARNTYDTQDTQDEQTQQHYDDNDDMDRKPPGKPNWTHIANRVAQRDEERRQEQQEQHTIDHSRRIEDKIHRFRTAQLEHYLSNNPTQEEVERLYRAIASEMRTCHMPIVSFDQLTPTSGTKPLDVILTPTVEELVNRELYVQLVRAIPHGATSLRNIIESYTQTEDGYGALTLIMKTSCTYLRTLQAPWGPTWTPELTSFAYLTKLKRFLANLSRTSQMHYTDKQIAIEFLQQAKQHLWYSNIATQYLTRLQLQHREHIGPEYDLSYLAAEMDMNQTNPSNPDPIIHKFSNTKDVQQTSTSNRREGKFQYRREVQCRICHNYGHDVDDQICRIGAQIYHTNQFSLINPKKAKDNAQAYSLTNNKKQIKKMRANLTDPNITDEEIQDHLETLAHAMVQQLQDEPQTHDEDIE